MSKWRADQLTKVNFEHLTDGNIKITFTSNQGSFGTEEILDEYILSPDALLMILESSD